MKQFTEKRKKEIVFIMVCIGIGVILFVIFWLGSDPRGTQVIVRVEGKQVASFSLEQDQTYEITGADGGKNQLVIADGTARIETADCPDERCVQMGRISHSGQSIICLPHQVVVEIQGGKEAETDAVAQ